MSQYEAEVTLPFPELDRATAALRGHLRLAAAYDDQQVPDWATLKVKVLEDDVDDHGRTWWRWSGTVSPS